MTGADKYTSEYSSVQLLEQAATKATDGSKQHIERLLSSVAPKPAATSPVA